MTADTTNNINNEVVKTKEGEEKMSEEKQPKQTTTITENNIKQEEIKNVVAKLPIISRDEKKSVISEIAKAEENIFTEYLTDKKLKEEVDFIKEIEQLKLSNEKNFMKIGKVIVTYQEKYKFNDKWSYLYQHLLDKVKIKRTQADKYVAVYKYCLEKYQKEKSTENMLNLGIEKLYLVSTLEDKTKQEKLEKFVTAEKLSVKELSALIKLQNKTSKILMISERFNKICNEQN